MRFPPGAWIVLLAAPLQAQTFGPWHALGPFAHPYPAEQMEPPQPIERVLKDLAPGGLGLDLALPVKSKEVTRSWRPIPLADASVLDVGELDLYTLLEPPGASTGWADKAVAYLYRRVECEQDVQLPAQCGSDDGLRLWLNGELLVDRGLARGLNLEDHQLTLRLHAGVNHLLVKVANEGGAWRFRIAPWARIEQQAIDQAIDRGVQFLLDTQLIDGSWDSHPEYGPGHPAFTAYTLLKSGLAPDDAAVQMALAAADARPAEQVYSASCVVLALVATHQPRHKQRIQALADQLVRWQREDLFDYPVHPASGNVLPADLSNTLYAALALRAARQAGATVPDRVWTDLIQGTLRCLGKEETFGTATGKASLRSAGFTYRVGGDRPTGSMTTAGLSVLAIAQEGAGSKLAPASLQKLRGAVGLGLNWLDRNMTWFQNPGENGHHYFWIYGVERAGTLLGVDVLGGLDWYWAGAAWLVKKQKDDGSWSSGASREEFVDTLLALLFLERATTPSTAAPLTDRAKRIEPSTPSIDVKPAQWEAGTATDELSIHARGAPSTVLWVGRLRPDLRRELEGPEGLVVQRLEFFGSCSADPGAGERLLGTVAGRTVRADDLRDLELAHVFDRAGSWSVRARLHVGPGAAGGSGAQTRVVTTPLVSFTVREVFDTRRLAYARDPARNLLAKLEGKAEASSRGGEARLACDKSYATGWLSAADDKQPWWRLTLPQPMPVAEVLFSHAEATPKHAAEPRAQQVEVWINGEQRFPLTLEADVRLKSSLALPPRTLVRTLEVRVLSIRGERLGEAAAGFAEIELVGTK